MLTIIFLTVLGAIVLGFALWVLAFGGMKRRGQSPKATVTAQHMDSEKKRSA